ncbi:properdin-like [Suricata suricatta]|uniref:properdin-like n=1 Tax=Suricata suricatta TaxID=37032 RepID=UPI0011552D4D|nr:properdin-like [Suricata suricatta]
MASILNVQRLTGLGGRRQEKGLDSDRGASRGGSLLGERVRNPSGQALAPVIGLGASGLPWDPAQPGRLGEGKTETSRSQQEPLKKGPEDPAAPSRSRDPPQMPQGSVTASAHACLGLWPMAAAGSLGPWIKSGVPPDAIEIRLDRSRAGPHPVTSALKTGDTRKTTGGPMGRPRPARFPA